MVPRRTMVPAIDDSQAPEEAEVVHEFLAFVLSDECYALPLTSIREILKLPPITEVPRAPTDVLGLVSVRGRVTTVIDLRRRLRMPESPPTKATRVLLVDDGRELLGAYVDRVLSVYRLGPDEVELAAAVGGDTAEYVMGIGRPSDPHGRSRGFGAPVASLPTPDDIVILLDPVQLFRR